MRRRGEERELGLKEDNVERGTRGQDGGRRGEWEGKMSEGGRERKGGKIY